MSNAISPWAVTASNLLTDNESEPAFVRNVLNFKFCIYHFGNSIWIKAVWPKGGMIAFRPVYSPDELVIDRIRDTDDGIVISLSSTPGSYIIEVDFPDAVLPVVHYCTRFTPAKDVFMPFNPRDVLIPGASGNAENTAGQIHASQEGIRSGLIFASVTRPSTGSFLYFQNLTSLGDYCQDTETSLASTVGGKWPELGFTLPPTQDKALKKDKEYVIADAYVALDTKIPKDQYQTAIQYMDMLATVYKCLPLPETEYHDYPSIIEKSLENLTNNKGCWSHRKGHPYLNAYVCDYNTPAEIMVQLAVLLPVYDYSEWKNQKFRIIDDLCGGLGAFYDENLKTIMRFLPSEEDKLDRSEEQKQPKVMDSWYLHHPLLNLSRMALKGDKMARKLFIDSTEFAIKVAHHFNYKWPVFYKMDTLEVIKEETQPGEGGEKDVAGIYAHVMLQAWELTGDKRYFNEAKKAARTLADFGFDLFYQANNTAFSAGALLRIYKETKDELYLNLSYVCIANIFRNVSLWQCNYGYGKNFPTFFALFPLSDAPYTAVYEEQEGFSAVHDYLMHADSIDILPSIKMLLAEFVRYLASRVVYYYPPMLPKDMLSDEVKTGEIDPNLWIALEDIHDGWEKSGAVGQEVYGAGLAFGVVPRQYIKVPEEDFLIFVDYPTNKVSAKKGKPVTFKLLGNADLSCRMRIVKTSDKKLPEINVITSAEGKLKGTAIENGELEYAVKGDQEITIKWNNK